MPPQGSGFRLAEGKDVPTLLVGESIFFSLHLGQPSADPLLGGTARYEPGIEAVAPPGARERLPKPRDRYPVVRQLGRCTLTRAWFGCVLSFHITSPGSHASEITLSALI